jgi:DNA polymerase III epsilon subunit-like protein
MATRFSGLSNIDPAGDGSLPALRERARAALQAAGVELPAAALAAKVFGVSQGRHWHDLLHAVLSADARFESTPAGWRLAGREPNRSRIDAFVAVAIGATGADPRRHRVVRISALGIQPGLPDAPFDLLVNPRRRVARYLLDAIRTSLEEIDEAPKFPEVAAALLEFIADRPLIGLGTVWIAAMLNAELQRASMRRLSNPLVDLDSAGELSLIVEKPTLSSIAHSLGFDHPKPNYPPADAAITARIARRLFNSQSGVYFAAEAVARRPVDRQPRASWPLTAALERPGVYLVLDEAEQVLYVGKAANLRRRLAAYKARPPGLERQLGGLLARASTVRLVESGSDLEARLLEASLIRRHRPPFNVQRRVHPGALFIRVAPQDTVPRVHLVRSPGADGAMYLGPFASERAARARLELVRELYPAATRRRLCYPASQREAVFAALRLFSGQHTEALAETRVRMRNAAAAGDAKQVDRMRKAIRRLLRLQPCPSPLIGSAPDEAVLVFEPARGDGECRAHLIRGARLVASGDIPLGQNREPVGNPQQILALLTPRDPAESHEEDVAIVMRWLGSLGEQCRMTRIGAESD